MLERLGSVRLRRLIDHRTPRKTLGIPHIQPGLLSDSPVWASAFSQHYFSTSLSGLNRLHYLRRHLTIFYHHAGTDQHRTGRGSPHRTLRSAMLITLESGHISGFSSDKYQNTPCQSGGGRRFSVLVRGSCHQPSCKSSFKKQISAVRRLFRRNGSFDREPTQNHRPTEPSLGREKPVFWTL